VDQARVEAALSRGDRRMARVVEEAFRRGAYLDPWSDHFQAGIWDAAFAAAGVDPGFFVEETWPMEWALPWDVVDLGLRKSFFRREWERAERAEPISTCGADACYGCGSFAGLCKEDAFAKPAPAPSSGSEEETGSPPPGRWRLTYRQEGPAALLGHLDTLRALERWLRRSGVRFALSRGFARRPRMVTGPPLPLGVEGWREVVEFEGWPAPDVEDRLERRAPTGFIPLGLEPVPEGSPRFSRRVRWGEYVLWTGNGSAARLDEGMTAFLDGPAEGTARKKIREWNREAPGRWRISLSSGGLKSILREALGEESPGWLNLARAGFGLEGGGRA